MKNVLMSVGAIVLLCAGFLALARVLSWLGV